MKHPFSQMCCILGRGDAFISQEIASCEIKSLRQDAQLAERKYAANAACSRAEQKLCCRSSSPRGCETHFCSRRSGLFRFKVARADQFHRHFVSGPDLKCGSSLVEQHIHTVKYGASGLLCLGKKSGLSGIVDDV